LAENDQIRAFFVAIPRKATLYEVHKICLDSFDTPDTMETQVRGLPIKITSINDHFRDLPSKPGRELKYQYYSLHGYM